MTGRRLIITTVALAALLAGTSTAGAHTEKTPSSVSVSWDGSAFDAGVDSSQPCIKKRKVSLFKRGENGALATGTTDANGNSSFSGLARENGDYYAKAAKRVLKKNDKHLHMCKAAKSDTDAKVRDCDQTTLFDASNGNGSQNIDVDDDMQVFVEGIEAFIDGDGYATSNPPIQLGPVSFGDDIQIVARNSGFFGPGPVSIEPISVQCSTGGGSGSVALDATGVPPGGPDAGGGEVFYDETYQLPVIPLTR
ncbi:MAG: hypothetical protein QOI31_368 [Solirubrobacterales bacterium]|nr:hypothetical protein [Solirubrobacterales bacterium]